MPLLLNSFSADVVPAQITLPCKEYGSWEESTAAKETLQDFSTWRYEMDEQEADNQVARFRMVFLNGASNPPGAHLVELDLGRFWRIGCLLIEDAVCAHFSNLGFIIEESHFERMALRFHPDSPDDAIELATGLSFAARRPFRDDPYRFSLAFRLEVRALFKDNLSDKSLAKIAPGMPVLYKPHSTVPSSLLAFRNRYLGKVRSIDFAAGTAAVMCRDDEPRSVALSDLRLEASPAVIKLFEQKVRSKRGPSQVIRTIQQLNLSLTKDNRRNVTALRDRLEQIRRLLYEAGSSRDQLVLPLKSFQSGSVSISLSPEEAVYGESW